MPRESQPATDAITVRAKDGSRVSERVVTLGPHDLFGILATGDAEPTGPPVLFLNSGRDPHTGPNRMWVDLSREWAALGFPCYRFDLSGLGDSPVRPGQVPNRVRVAEAFDDVVDAVADVVGGPSNGRPDGASDGASDGEVAPVVLAGLCAGAYQVLESAIDLRPRSVLSVNPILRFQPWEVDLGGPMDPRRRFCKPAGSLRQTYRALPSWKILRLARARYLTFAGRLSRQRTSIDWLEEAAAQGTDILCICGEEEAVPFFEGVSADRTTVEDERCRLQVIPGLDHGLMMAGDRVQVASLLTAHISSLFPHGATTARTDTSQPSNS